MITSIVIANLWGAATGEWRDASKGTKRTLVLGLAILLAAFTIFGLASRLIVPI
jgi:hypothetical protein